MLGRLWTLLSPLINIMVFVLIFSAIMGARLEGFGADVERFTYSIYLISGILAWTAFAKSLSAITNLFIERAGMITKINTSLAALPLSVPRKAAGFGMDAVSSVESDPPPASPVCRQSPD